MALINKLTAIADAIRSKTGGTEPLTLDGMAEAIDSIVAGGGDEASVLDNFIDGSITEITSNVTAVGNYSLYQKASLRTVSFPNVTTIGNYSFAECSSLETINFPKLETISHYAFQKCTSLKTVDFPLVETIGTYAFAYCNITSANLPRVKSVNSNAFKDCKLITSVCFPLANSIEGYGFYNCTQLTTADFPTVSNINGANVFYSCSSLTALILRSEIVCSVARSDAFSNSGVAKGTTFIYVPSALLDSYKTATNWSTYASQFRALEDYTVDGTITGELDESKI